MPRVLSLWLDVHVTNPNGIFTSLSFYSTRQLLQTNPNSSLVRITQIRHFPKEIETSTKVKPLKGGFACCNLFLDEIGFLSSRGGLKFVPQDGSSFGFIRTCLTSHKFRCPLKCLLMISLPKSGVTVDRPFSVVGVDYAGLLLVRFRCGSNAKITKGICAYLFRRLFSLNSHRIFPQLFFY